MSNPLKSPIEINPKTLPNKFFYKIWSEVITLPHPISILLSKIASTGGLCVKLIWYTSMGNPRNIMKIMAVVMK